MSSPSWATMIHTNLSTLSELHYIYLSIHLLVSCHLIYTYANQNPSPTSSAPSAPAAPPRPPNLTSVPTLLFALQNEWDAVVLETFNLRQQNAQLRQELSHALYKEDAAMRVLARIQKERDEAREALANIQNTLGGGDAEE